MRLQDIMTRDVKMLDPNTCLRDAAEQMAQMQVGSLPVTNGQKILGIVTDRDIVTRAVAKGQDPVKTKVLDIMTRGITYVFEDQDVEEAARLMETKGIRRLVVLNRDKRLVGFVSLGDVSTQSGEEGLTGRVMCRIAEMPPSTTAMH